MRPPCEIVQRDFLPDLRSSLSRILDEQGLSQSEIADKIGLTQAAVSKYLKQKGNGHKIDPQVHTLATRIASYLLTNTKSQSAILKEVCGTCMSLRIGSDICAIHRKSNPALAKEECDICAELLGGSDRKLTLRSKVLQEMKEALDQIQISTVFYRLVPEVRANLVSCSRDASDLSDVAGVPGRITLIDGKARIFLSPQFGASNHTASLLLSIKKKWSQYRSCLCLSGRNEVIQAALEEKVNMIHLKESENEANEIAKVAIQLQKTRPREFLGINVPGGIGVESILYIFGKSAIDLATLSERIALHIK